MNSQNGFRGQSPVIIGNNPIELYNSMASNGAAPFQHPVFDQQKEVRDSEKNNQIRVQAARIQKLEERIALLLEENQKQDSILNFKQQESLQWQENYNALRDDFQKKTKYFLINLKVRKSNQMSQLEEEIDQLQKKQGKTVDDIEKNEQNIRNYHNEIYARNEDIQYWKERSNQAMSAQQKISELERQIEILSQENSKLNKLLMQSNDYTLQQ